MKNIWMMILMLVAQVSTAQDTIIMANPTPWDTTLVMITPAVFPLLRYSPASNIELPQKYNWRKSLRKSILPASMTFLGGAAGGLREALHFRREQFFQRFPNANRNFWDTNISSEVSNKIMGVPMDAYHLLQYPHTWLTFGAGTAAGINVALPISRKVKRPWWHVAADIAVQSGASLLGYVAGSTLTYNVLCHK